MISAQLNSQLNMLTILTILTMITIITMLTMLYAQLLTTPKLTKQHRVEGFASLKPQLSASQPVPTMSYQTSCLKPPSDI